MPDTATAPRFRSCPVPEAELRELLAAHTNQAVAQHLGVPLGSVSYWRHRLAVPPRLKPGGARVLAAIHAQPGCSLSDLARTLGVTREAMRQAVETLEARGLVVTVVRRHRSYANTVRHCWAVEEETS